ncbi:MAG: hypothetical protein EBQ89_04065 [Alphaproteobacteria bacterium]|nr:hypothetical protein [Alphaproteobacteria bacterium]
MRCDFQREKETVGEFISILGNFFLFRNGSSTEGTLKIIALSLTLCVAGVLQAYQKGGEVQGVLKQAYALETVKILGAAVGKENDVAYQKQLMAMCMHASGGGSSGFGTVACSLCRRDDDETLPEKLERELRDNPERAAELFQDPTARWRAQMIWGYQPGMPIISPSQ